jgi:hypothetical protein
MKRRNLVSTNYDSDQMIKFKKKVSLITNNKLIIRVYRKKGLKGSFLNE